LVGTGQRYLFLKKLNQDEKPKLIDWILTGGMGVVGIVFMGWGIFLLFNEKSMGWALLLFGLIGLLSVRKDIENYSGKSKKRQYWLRAHIARIVGAYIASMTAFLVVNQSFFPNFIPEVIYWILPTFVLTPLIVYWIRKFAKK
jgi:amino acid transporter